MNLKRFSELTPIEQTLLLGFLPLLGATAHLGVALVAGVVGVITTLCVLMASRVATQQFGEAARWTVLVATALGVSHFLTAAAVFLVPLPPGAHPYLYLIGVTPLVYIGVQTEDVSSPLVPMLARYFVLTVGLGAVREALGSASLFGWKLPMLDGQPPVGILAAPSGALMVFATVALCSFLVRIRPASQEVAGTKEGAG